MADLIISGTTVPLASDVPISLNYQIADVQEPDNRDSSFSKTLVVVGTKEVNQLFTHIFEVNISVQTTGTTNFNPDFNPNLSVDASLIEQDVEQLRGKIQLLNIVMANRNDEYRIEYELALRGNIGNIFIDLGESTLDELDLSEFDHTYDRATQINSRATSVQQNGSPVAFAVGKGYVYYLVDYGYSGGLEYDVTNHFPAIYVKQYIDTIFSTVGWSFSSTFFDSAFFKRLTIPFNANRLSLDEADIDSRLFRAGLSSNGFFGLNNDNLPTIFTVVWDDDSTSPNFDNSAVYDTATGKWTINKDGRYSIKTRLYYGFKHFPDQNSVTGRVGVPIQSKLSIIEERSTGDVVLSVKQNPIYTFDGESFDSGDEVRVGDTQINMDNVFIKSGNKIRIEADVKINSTIGNNYWETAGGVPVGGTIHAIGFKTDINNIINSELSNRVFKTHVVDGADFPFNDAIPPEVKQKDLLIEMIRIFNLYVDIDKDDPNKLLIETRDDFHSLGTTQDWSLKLDQDTLEERPMGELDFRTVIMEYQEDKDFFNEQYQEANGETYGRKRLEIDNDFLKNEKVYKTIFAATPLVETAIPDIIIPRILNLDKSGVVKATTSKIRLLHYSGVKTSSQTYRYLSTKAGDIDTNEYGFAGHLDDAINPTLDLSFGVPKEVFYVFPPAEDYTNNNIFNKYHKKFFEQITSPDSRLVTGQFNLSIDDIKKLDFRDKFYFNNTLHILNKVNDFDPSNDEQTRCEFLRLIEGTAFVAEVKATNGGNDVVFATGDPLPVMQRGEQGFSNVFNAANNQLVLGSGNFVDNTASAIIIQGVGNSVGAGSENVSIMASSGVIVEGGASNVMVQGTSNLVITESDVTFINGVQITPNGLVIQSDRLDGGLNTVVPLLANTKWQIVEGGENEVRSVDATSPTTRIDGGENET